MESDPANDGEALIDTIMVVDAEVLVRMALASYLRECGYRVVEAVNAQEALMILEQSDIVIDIVLSDVQLPGSMDGFGLVTWIRTNRPQVQAVLAGTPARSAEAAGALCEKGPDLRKPYDHQVIVERIRRMLAGRQPL